VDTLEVAKRAAEGIIADFPGELVWEQWTFARWTGWRLTRDGRPVAYVIDTEAVAA
jgi:hypothetical protein